MAKRHDFSSSPTSLEPVWDGVAFPEAPITMLPEHTGLYRFACCLAGTWKTLYASTTFSDLLDTIRACYSNHLEDRNNPVSKLSDLYSFDNLQFDHYSCDLAEAERQKQDLIANEKPEFNIEYKLVINNAEGPQEPF